MTKKIDEILSESVGLSEETRAQITSLWESKVSQAREEISANLREEFARKFEHDRGLFAESIDQFLEDRIRAELESFAEDRRATLEEGRAYRQKIAEHTQLMEKFITDRLAHEVRELRGDKEAVVENLAKLEEFVLSQLASEIREFQEEKMALVKKRAQMVSEGREAIKTARADFVRRAGALVESTIDSALRREITQFRDDIRVARENEFGRKIFESVVAEYMTSHLNEGSELSRLRRELNGREQEIAQLRESVKSGKKLAEGLDVRLKATQDLVQRQGVLNDLLSPLSKEKRAVMKELLESVQTSNLGAAFNKYLPTVLNEGSAPKSAARGQLNESALTAKTGDRAGVAQLNESSDSDDLRKILSLAGILDK